ncbi:MAG: hypothetical protein AAGF04_05915 [Chlamydiota bacterium]
MITQTAFLYLCPKVYDCIFSNPNESSAYKSSFSPTLIGALAATPLKAFDRSVLGHFQNTIIPKDLDLRPLRKRLFLWHSYVSAHIPPNYQYLLAATFDDAYLAHIALGILHQNGATFAKGISLIWGAPVAVPIIVQIALTCLFFLAIGLTARQVRTFLGRYVRRIHHPIPNWVIDPFVLSFEQYLCVCIWVTIGVDAIALALKLIFVSTVYACFLSFPLSLLRNLSYRTGPLPFWSQNRKIIGENRWHSLRHLLGIESGNARFIRANPQDSVFNKFRCAVTNQPIVDAYEHVQIRKREGQVQLFDRSTVDRLVGNTLAPPHWWPPKHLPIRKDHFFPSSSVQRLIDQHVQAASAILYSYKFSNPISNEDSQTKICSHRAKKSHWFASLRFIREAPEFLRECLYDFRLPSFELDGIKKTDWIPIGEEHDKYKCPISVGWTINPVQDITIPSRIPKFYEQTAIQTWLNSHSTSPHTRQPWDPTAVKVSEEERKHVFEILKRTYEETVFLCMATYYHFFPNNTPSPSKNFRKINRADQKDQKQYPAFQERMQKLLQNKTLDTIPEELEELFPFSEMTSLLTKKATRHPYCLSPSYLQKISRNFSYRKKLDNALLDERDLDSLEKLPVHLWPEGTPPPKREDWVPDAGAQYAVDAFLKAWMRYFKIESGWA